MANENSKDPITPKPQSIPLAKIHDLPGAPVFRQPDKSYGGLVTSIQAGGVKEPVILRLREDGEYQLVAGYRRCRASELAKKQDIPALVYEMSMQEALRYHSMANGTPNAPVPGKLVSPPSQEEKPQISDVKGPEKPTTGVRPKDAKPAEGAAAPAAPTPEDKGKDGPPKAPEKPVPGEKPKDAKPAPAEKPKDAKPTEGPAAPALESKGKDGPPKAPEKPGPAEKPKDAKPAERPATPATPTTEDKGKDGPPKAPEKPGLAEKSKDPKPTEGPAAPAAPAPEDKGKDGPPKAPEKPAPAEKPKPAEVPAAPAKAPAPGPAAKGPAGTAISQVFEERLAPPDEKALKDLPVPKEGESFFITLHPAYLEKSQFNVFSVDQSSENFKELMKSVELVGIKDPVLARLKPEGGLEILSGQRRHLAASALNYPVPTIIQKIDDADAKIIVADGNLHRDKISSYDLSRALRMKMEGMKQKSGRRKKGTMKADELYSDEKLAQEMGMKVSKLNRIIRLSEATKDVCDRVDDNSLPLSIASAISFLKPENQDMVLHLSDLGYKLTNERVERMKKVDKGGKLNEMIMRNILDDKDLAPKQAAPQQNAAPSAPPPVPASPDVPRPPEAPPAPTTTETSRPTEAPNIPPAPSGPAAPETPGPTAPETSGPAAPPAAANTPPEKAPMKGEQERPEYTKVILAGDRLRKYFPDVSMTPREIEESVYEALEERRQRQLKAQQKEGIFKGRSQTR